MAPNSASGHIAAADKFPRLSSLVTSTEAAASTSSLPRRNAAARTDLEFVERLTKSGSVRLARFQILAARASLDSILVRVGRADLHMPPLLRLARGEEVDAADVRLVAVKPGALFTMAAKTAHGHVVPEHTHDPCQLLPARVVFK